MKAVMTPPIVLKLELLSKDERRLKPSESLQSSNYYHNSGNHLNMLVQPSSYLSISYPVYVVATRFFFLYIFNCTFGNIVRVPSRRTTSVVFPLQQPRNTFVIYVFMEMDSHSG